MHIPVLLFFSNLFSTDMLVIVFFALILFGGEKLPEIARGLGKGIRDFKDASEGVKREINNQINSYEEKKAEEALNKKAEEVQNQLPEAGQTDGPLPVENTMPVNESLLNGSEPEAHAAPDIEEHHAGVSHTGEEAAANEHNRNT